jgi:hypothetical protein
MNDFQFGRHRGVPLHAAPKQPDAAADTTSHEEVQQNAAPQDMAQNNALQQDAASAPDMQVHAPELEAEPQPYPKPLPIEAYTISVDQVRARFRAKGVTKSKDTVQRWCRTGELDCQKRGVLGRYFTNEPSLLALEEKLLPDMMADTGQAHFPADPQPEADADTGVQLHAGEASAAESGIPVHAAEDAETDRSMRVHAAADPSACSDMQVHAAEGDAERSAVQPDAAEDAAARSDVPDETARRVPVQAAEAGESSAQQVSAARLEAEVEGLRAQLENRDHQIAFLQEEIRSARDQRSAVVQISNRMLETLETMAVGGRLERRNAPPETRPDSAQPSTDDAAVHSPDRGADRVYWSQP